MGSKGRKNSARQIPCTRQNCKYFTHELEEVKPLEVSELAVEVDWSSLVLEVEYSRFES